MSIMDSFLTKITPYLKNHTSMGRILSFKVVAVSIRTYEEKDSFFFKSILGGSAAVLPKNVFLSLLRTQRTDWVKLCSSTSKH